MSKTIINKKNIPSPIIYYLFSIFYFLFPSVSYADYFAVVNDLLTSFGHLVGQAIPIAAGLAVLFFFWGVALYIFRAGDETKAKEGKSIMIYGVIGIFVIFSIWGLIKFIGDNLGIQTTSGSGSNPTGETPPTSAFSGLE